jgi:ATP-dependent DNA ligase
MVGFMLDYLGRLGMVSRMNDIKPALCSSMDFDVGVYWQGEGWIVEEKKDGIRCMVHVGHESVATGRRVDEAGRIQPLMRQEVAQGWAEELIGCVFDGELMEDGTYWIFDIVRDRGDDIRRQPLMARKAALRSLADWLPAHAKILPSFNNVRELGDFDEGIVWKDLSAKYVSNEWIKAKRTVTVDVQVLAYEGGGVALTVGNGRVQGVPEDITPGTMIECTSYGVWPSGKLKTGRFMRVRLDK